MQPKKEKAVLGYPHIEQLLETENFDGINQSFAKAYDSLQTIMNERGSGLKKQKDARKAMKAYELTTDMIKELLKVKYQLLKPRDGKAS